MSTGALVMAVGSTVWVGAGRNSGVGINTRWPIGAAGARGTVQAASRLLIDKPHKRRTANLV